MAQELVIASIKAGSLLLPWDFRTYVNKKYLKEADFEKSTQQAVQLIKEFEPPYQGKVVVSVDSALCVKRVIQAADEEAIS